MDGAPTRDKPEGPQNTITSGGSRELTICVEDVVFARERCVAVGKNGNNTADSQVIAGIGVF